MLLACSVEDGFGEFLQQDVRLAVEHAVSLLDGGVADVMLGEHFSYATSMGGFAAVALVVGCVVIGLGPEAHGVSFRKQPAA